MTKKTVVTFKRWEKVNCFSLEHFEIKIKRKKFGQIIEKEGNKENYFLIYISVKKEKTKDDPCDFRWIILDVKFPSSESAKEFLKENIDRILEKHDVYFFEKE
jgi:hypothetical protein